jgi:superfamily II RNA helicase
MLQDEMPKWHEPRFTNLVASLHDADYLPAIYFVFSRARCNKYAIATSKSDLVLVDAAEHRAIKTELDQLWQLQPDSVPLDLVEPLLSGVASHHAGLLPGWKALVERLFQKGLIKVVFATETLAAGINMPARTTVITALSRHRDGETVCLKHNDLLQMAGRAGRRGYDLQGQCVVTQMRCDALPILCFDCIPPYDLHLHHRSTIRTI